MPLSQDLQSLIESANLAIERVHLTTPVEKAEDHTVGCAVLTQSGIVFTGVNIHHFTGGPCAESVAIGNAVQAGAKGEDFTHIVAVRNQRRGVLNPCGRCRQMLLDYYPHIKAIVVDKAAGDQLLAVDVKELLPYSYIVCIASELISPISNRLVSGKIWFCSAKMSQSWGS